MDNKLETVIKIVRNLSKGFDREDESGVLRGMRLLENLYKLDDPEKFIQSLIAESGVNEEEFYNDHIFRLDIDVEDRLKEAVESTK